MNSPSTQAPGGPPKLSDPHGRRLSYLRLSVTDRCNYRCTYCMPAEGVAKLEHDQVLSLEEMARVARAAVGLGVNKIRLTGGEPLIRRDLEVLLAELAELRPRPDVRLTTNGYFLAQNLDMLAQRGVSTVNVSMDSLDPAAYAAITGLGPRQGGRAFGRAWEAVEEAVAAGRMAVKLNVVLLAGLNHHEAPDFARLTLDMPLAVRFIEYMPVGRHKAPQPERFFSCGQAEEAIAHKLGRPEPLPHRPADGPARRAKLPGAAGELGFISAVSSHFCATCNRLRLSAEGRLVPCLFSEAGVDVRQLLRANGGQAELAGALMEAAAIKPRHHEQSEGRIQAHGAFMSRLGG